MNTQRTLILAIVAVVIAAGLYWLLRPAPVAPPPGGSAPAEKVFELAVRDEKLASGPAVIQVSEGDRVTLRFQGDKEEEVHLHGYDRMIELAPGTSTDLTFDANLTGRFIFELEDAKVDLGAVEVQPR